MNAGRVPLRSSGRSFAYAARPKSSTAACRQDDPAPRREPHPRPSARRPDAMTPATTTSSEGSHGWRRAHLAIEGREYAMCLRKHGKGVGETAGSIGRDRAQGACAQPLHPPLLRVDRPAGPSARLLPGLRRRLREAERGDHDQPRVLALGRGVRRRPDGGGGHRPRCPPRQARPVPGRVIPREARAHAGGAGAQNPLLGSLAQPGQFLMRILFKTT